MLTKKAIDKIKSKDGMKCRNRLAFEMNVNSRTVDRWVEVNSIMLTTAKALAIIESETGLKESQILEPVHA